MNDQELAQAAWARAEHVNGGGTSRRILITAIKILFTEHGWTLRQAILTFSALGFMKKPIGIAWDA